MKSFDLMSMMNNASLSAGDGQPKYELKCLPITALYPDPENQNTYSVDKIEELARDIEFAGAVLHNLVVRAAGEDGKYRIISGERRWRASCLLVKERCLDQFREVNCLVEHENDPDILDLLLILTNSSARELTDAEKMRQAERMTEILKKLSQKTKLQGRIRDLVAEKLNTTSGQLARYHAIAKNLTNPELKQAFEKGKLGISAAYEASGLSEDGQEKLASRMDEGRGIPLQAVTVAKMQERQDSPEWQEKMRKVRERRASGKGTIPEKQEKPGQPLKKMSSQIKQKLDVQARLFVLGVLREKRDFCKTLLQADGDNGTIEDARWKATVIGYIDTLLQEIEKSAKVLAEGRQTGKTANE